MHLIDLRDLFMACPRYHVIPKSYVTFPNNWARSAESGFGLAEKPDNGVITTRQFTSAQAATVADLCTCKALCKSRHVVTFRHWSTLNDPEGWYGISDWLKIPPLQNLTIWRYFDRMHPSSLLRFFTPTWLIWSHAGLGVPITLEAAGAWLHARGWCGRIRLRISRLLSRRFATPGVGTTSNARVYFDIADPVLRPDK